MAAEYSVYRDDNGIPHIESDTLDGMYRGLGYAHGKDRGMQSIFMRILGQGRVSEILDSSDASLSIDLFFRRMNWAQIDVERELGNLEPTVRASIEAYCVGVNDALKGKVPWEFRLLGYSPEPWAVSDSLLLAKMTGYLTLAQSQGEMERLFIEMVQAGISNELLDELFPGILGGFERDLVHDIPLAERIVSPAELWGRGAPRLSSSNNWVVSGSMTKSGMPLLSNDIHLETNRMPNVWYEVALRSGDRYGVGLTMPGMPALLVGRTNDIGWGVTYTYMDSEDSWVERCKEGSFYRDGDGWIPFNARRETIKRKKKGAVEATFWENLHGVADVDPLNAGVLLGSDERYVRTVRWAGDSTGARTMNGMHGLWSAQTAEEAMESVGGLEVSFNWVFTDEKGSIGYQMSGAMPLRRKGVYGFVPLPGWDPANDWQGVVTPSDLPRSLNPESGFIITTNQNLNHLGKTDPINVGMGPYRAERIEALIAGRDDLSAEDMRVIQRDLYSIEAAQFMDVLRPFLPDTENGKVLSEWDCSYSADSRGAFLFEQCYRELYIEVFGSGGMGTETVEKLFDESGIFIDFYVNFNHVLLSEDSAWFAGRPREDIYRTAVQRGLLHAVRQWGDVRKVTLSHIIFGGTLPRALGFDRGPITLEGGRATVQQGQIYRSAGRTTTFAPSARFTADMSEKYIQTNLSGGPSDRRFSRWYLVGLKEWLRNVPKRLDPQYQGKRLPLS